MDRLSHVSPFLVMDILSKAKNIKDCIHMEIGEPDLEPPPSVYEHLERAIKEKRQGYTPSLGIKELREKIAEHYYRFYGVEISPERIAITPGTSGAFTVAYTLLATDGDKIGLTDPSYPCYKNIARILGFEPLFINTKEENGYKLKPEEIPDNIKVLHISSPVNPTGAVYGKEEIKRIVEVCHEKGIYLISDEIYHGLIYEKPYTTALAFSDDVIVINGFSKFFCMPGFRIGWMILPERLVRKAEIIIQNMFISTPTLSQYAALGAFDYEYLNKIRETFKRRRDILYNGIKDFLDIKVHPEGAFYLWVKTERFHKDSLKLSKEILEKARVAVTPGVDFGENETKKYIRLSYTRREEELKEGIERLREFFSNYDSRK